MADEEKTNIARTRKNREQTSERSEATVRKRRLLCRGRATAPSEEVECGRSAQGIAAQLKRSTSEARKDEFSSGWQRGTRGIFEFRKRVERDREMERNRTARSTS
jgi:hypothetical protein